MILFQVPGNANLTEMLLPSQVKNFLLDMGRRAQNNIVRTRLTVNQSLLSALGICVFPSITCVARNTAISARERDILGVLCIFKNLEFSPNISLGICHCKTSHNMTTNRYHNCQAMSGYLYINPSEGAL